jgi:hypothetical protein
MIREQSGAKAEGFVAHLEARREPTGLEAYMREQAAKARSRGEALIALADKLVLMADTMGSEEEVPK